MIKRPADESYRILIGGEVFAMGNDLKTITWFYTMFKADVDNAKHHLAGRPLVLFGNNVILKTHIPTVSKSGLR